jgi:hypothetical protein
MARHGATVWGSGDTGTDTKAVWGLGRSRCGSHPAAWSHGSSMTRSQHMGWLCGTAREDSIGDNGSWVTAVGPRCRWGWAVTVLGLAWQRRW